MTADFLFFKALEIGVVGIVVAIVVSNFVLVTIFNSIFSSSHMSFMQGVGVVMAVFGIVLVTAGDSLKFEGHGINAASKYEEEDVKFYMQSNRYSHASTSVSKSPS